ncbi:CRS2-associated factor 1, chloroplastic isoform X1 [Cucurbita maxima]|uniref:CRS2-associated factor 1, chloroplastic isoform X1 n=1 Tax=Cucurbita maxima TaxID=3661 RepID=A0A6J1KD01_CUCMA|nr:CRS2-associated factor 1, chloroplastic isoform X1 [Cucurbita maxima]
MAFKLSFPFPIFSPQFSPNSTPSHRPLTDIRFSRWNNANAEKFEQRRRSQQEIEDEIRRERRFDSAARITDLCDSNSSTSAIDRTETFRSVGTPSYPSRPSIPGRKSKYSKNPNPGSPPPFRQVSKTKKTMSAPKEMPIGVEANVSLSEDGVSYVIDGAPFEFKYSYTETPKLKPIKLREPYAPFGPTTMPRPWMGRAPLPPSQKNLPEFDSFQLPPKNKKGVKTVQAPGPFLAGSGPKYVMSREEILGEPLTEEEIKTLIRGSIKSNRQLNIGRDGLTHNMLDNIHAHWKRRRVCKIKCKGVCTVDMDNVKQQLEEKTGGKIIYSRGGALYLYRGRNYNYKTRPRFPLMLWKPAAPVYPRLLKQVPDGLTLDEVTEMRKKGRKLIPICKLGKNGVYSNLVKHVREAFEECELVRVNCQGLNESDFKKIGAKLRDLVPCVLISFESEHILLWRGKDWKSSLPYVERNPVGAKARGTNEGTISAPSIEEREASVENTSLIDQDLMSLGSAGLSTGGNEELDPLVAEKSVSADFDSLTAMMRKSNSLANADDMEATGSDVQEMNTDSTCDDSESWSTMSGGETETDSGHENSDFDEAEPMEQSRFNAIAAAGNLETKVGGTSEATQALNKPASYAMDGVLQLLKQAVENGGALVLDDSSLDADVIYRRAVAFSQSAPPEPVFRHQPKKKVAVDKGPEQTSRELEVKEESAVSVERGSGKKDSKTKKKKNFGEYNFSSPQGSLGVDELAKLLA